MNCKPIRIVALGDSMTDTAGEDCRALARELARYYPKVRFELFNYGVGGTRAGYGLWRLTHGYEFRNRKWPPLVSLDPDVVLLESFAYNNATDGLFADSLRHFRNMHRRIVNILQRRTHARIVFVATIAPDPDRFLETVPGFHHTPVSIRRRMARDRVHYLQEAGRLARRLELPLVNVCQATVDARKRGIPLSTFIDHKDWIHPGPSGHALTARLVVQTLQRHRIIEDCLT